MTRLTILMVLAAGLWLLAPLIAGAMGTGAPVILPLAAAMFAVQVAGKVHLLRPAQPVALLSLLLGALLFAALGWAAGRGASVLLETAGWTPGWAPWAMLAVAGAASWRIRGLSDPRVEAALDEALRELDALSEERRD